MIINNQNPMRFHGVETLRDNLYITTVEENLKSFLDYGFLHIGGFTNVSIPTSGLYNNGFHVCKPTNDSSRPQNSVWQTPRKDWVWESGIQYKSTSPINISGVYINNTLYPAPTGASGVIYQLDYSNGQIIFNNKLSDNTKVELAYSYRWCQISKSSNNDLWKELQKLTYQPSSSINSKDKGDYSVLANHRIQLPAIVIETAPQNSSKPYELGSLAAFRSQDILLHIYTENINDANTIVDILRLQEDKVVILYDLQKVVSSGLYGLMPNGSKNIGGMNYGQLISSSDLQWNRMLIKKVAFVDMQKNASSNFVWCMIRLTSEIIV
jgi:hypothetical protein